METLGGVKQLRVDPAKENHGFWKSPAGLETWTPGLGQMDQCVSEARAVLGTRSLLPRLLLHFSPLASPFSAREFCSLPASVSGRQGLGPQPTSWLLSADAAMAALGHLPDATKAEATDTKGHGCGLRLICQGWWVWPCAQGLPPLANPAHFLRN